jgi:hypothetical protein
MSKQQKMKEEALKFMGIQIRTALKSQESSFEALSWDCEFHNKDDSCKLSEQSWSCALQECPFVNLKGV